jgi:hypothetical protein
MWGAAGHEKEERGKAQAEDELTEIVGTGQSAEGFDKQWRHGVLFREFLEMALASFGS